MTLWSAKGGVGLSTVVSALAAMAAREHETTLVDLAGDQPGLCGLATEPDVGVGDWLAGGASPRALERITHPIAPGLRLLPTGGGASEWSAADLGFLGDGLVQARARTVVDAGVIAGDSPRAGLVARSRRSLLVTRCCYLALRRATASSDLLEVTDGVVAVLEEGRALDVDDVARVLGLPVVATVPTHHDIARAVDAGTLTTRVPRRLARSLAPLHAFVGAPGQGQGAA